MSLVRRLTALTAFGVLVAGCGGSGGGGGTTGAAVAATHGAGPAPTFYTLSQTRETGVRGSPASATVQRVVTDHATYMQLWAEHQSHRAVADPAPPVDWSRSTVVGVFLGERPRDGYAVEVVDVADVDSHTVVVRYARTAPSGPTAAQPVSPAHIVAVDRPNAQVQFEDVTSRSRVQALDAVHGRLVSVPTTISRKLAFLEDGASAPREVEDTSALLAAGARAGDTLVLSGEAEANRGGATALAEVVRITTFALDDVAVTARLDSSGAGPVLRTAPGEVFLPTGALAQVLLALPPADVQGKPLRVTGRRRPGTAEVEVTSFRVTREVSLRIVGGLTGVDDLFHVTDLPDSGAYRSVRSWAIRPGEVHAGRGLLDAGVRADLEALVRGADLLNQPTQFRPASPILDAPSYILEVAGPDGAARIDIALGSTLPAGLDALLKRLGALSGATPRYHTLEAGSFSQVTQPGVRVVRDQATWQQVWAAHAGSGPGGPPPAVDFSKHLVVGVFLGRKATGGHRVAVVDLERREDDLLLTVEATAPAPGTNASQVLTAPYELVLVEHHGLTGDLEVEGLPTAR